MFTEIKIKLEHITLAAVSNTSKINPKKPTLLLLHGYLDNANSFIDLLPELNEWQCIAIDMAGHGHSEHRSAGAHYHLVDYAYDLHQIINTLQLEKIVLVGHSLGAIVCSIFASTQAPQLCGFIAIESCGPLCAPEDTTSQQIAACFESRLKTQKAIKNPSSMSTVIKARCLISDLNEEQANTILSRNIKIEENGSLLWLTDKRLRTTSAFRMTEAQAIDILNKINCPRVIILGDKGFDKVKSNIEKRKDSFLDTPLYTFSGGHHVHMQSLKEVSTTINKHVQSFISL